MSLGKYTLHLLFNADPKTRDYVPETAICNRLNLRQFLDRYTDVYIKPTGGLQGIGVVKAWKEKKRYAYVVERGIPKYCSTAAEMYEKLGIGKWGRHVVQRGIELAKINGSPFDIRLMMLRDARGVWKYAGMLARVAGKQSVISNIKRGGGYVIDADTAITKSLRVNGKTLEKLKENIINLGYNCNTAISRYRYFWQIGYDIGIDPRGRISLIEANPAYPDHSLFLKLKDKTMYWTIKRMASVHRRKQIHLKR